MAGDHLSATFLRSAMIDQVANDIAARFGLRGPLRVVSTACATGIHAIGDAARMIMFGCGCHNAGGAEAAICELGIAGQRGTRGLDRFNDTPTRASRPWDKDRDGFVMGEGAGMLVLRTGTMGRHGMPGSMLRWPVMACPAMPFTRLRHRMVTKEPIGR